MDKYTKTAGLNYLSENSYKGDGSPGMVMGIASDARGDTNTYEGLGDMIGKGIHKFIDYLTSARFKNIGGEKPGIEVNKHMSPLVQTSRQVILTFKNGYGVSILPEYRLGGRSGLEIIPGSYEAMRLRKAEPGNTKPRGPDNEDGPIIKLKNGDLYVTSGENMRRLDDAELDDVLITTQKADDRLLRDITPEGLEEAGKPTTSSKHSTERDLKKYDPAHGHTKPEGGKPGVCSCITSSGPSTDCAKCDGTGEIITPKRKDPKVDEALDAIKKLSGLEENISGNKPDTIDSEMDAYFGSKPGELEEGTNGAVVIDAQQSSKEEFDAVYKGAYDYDKILADYPLDEADGSGSYGGQSPLTYQHDDELNEIAKLSGLGEERKRRPDADDYDDFDDEDEKAEDPDKDRVPHILMQVKKALDVDGDHEIQFENGDKHKFSVINLNLFLTEYMNMKPEMREKMQQAAIVGQEEFETIIELLSPKQK